MRRAARRCDWSLLRHVSLIVLSIIACAEAEHMPISTIIVNERPQSSLSQDANICGKRLHRRLDEVSAEE